MLELSLYSVILFTGISIHDNLCNYCNLLYIIIITSAFDGFIRVFGNTDQITKD